jgi:Zn ribbon nucleic-acid-binding protein
VTSNLPPTEATGGCPACKSQDVDVPDNHEADTVVVCKSCGHTAPHLIFFKEGDA